MLKDNSQFSQVFPRIEFLYIFLPHQGLQRSQVVCKQHNPGVSHYLSRESVSHPHPHYRYISASGRLCGVGYNLDHSAQSPWVHAGPTQKLDYQRFLFTYVLLLSLAISSPPPGPPSL